MYIYIYIHVYAYYDPMRPFPRVPDSVDLDGEPAHALAAGDHDRVDAYYSILYDVILYYNIVYYNIL